MLYAFLFLPALAGIAFVLLRPRRQPVLEEAVVVEAAATITGEAEPLDPGAPDTGAPDTGAPDTGAPDTGAPDTGASDPLDALEALLGELERATLDERDVAEIEALADELEAAAARLELERVG